MPSPFSDERRKAPASPDCAESGSLGVVGSFANKVARRATSSISAIVEPWSSLTRSLNSLSMS